ncbi:MAG TPA: hypothetical protein PLE30_11205 [Candidatus Kapabacteria bacterium]|nr:hypothetical protein [Candidatus Kapabacteria bacterium]
MLNYKSYEPYGGRKYNDATGSFTSVYPLFEKFHGWSPYQYCGNKINRNIGCQY